MPRRLILLLVSLTTLPTRAAAGPTYELLRSFTEVPHEVTGKLLEASDGDLYGLASQGGAFGLGGIIRLHRGSGEADTVTTIHSFNGADGAVPYGRLMQSSDGNLYGTTCAGGASDFGTVFRMTPQGVLTTLHSFDGTFGYCPLAGLTEAGDGNFYGMAGSYTIAPGTIGPGTIFRITRNGVFTHLRFFGGYDNGADPQGELVHSSDGHLYGVTASGGATAGNGTFFRLTLTGEFTIVYTFRNENGGPWGPSSLVQAIDGSFLGVFRGPGTAQEGPGGVFRVTTAGALTIAHSLSASEGSWLRSLEVGADGAVYGVHQGPYPDRVYGGVFRLTPGGAFERLHTFTFWDGSLPAAIMLTSGGRFYGSTYRGGSSFRGVIFSISASGAFSLSHSFTDPTPLYPVGRLVRAGAGEFYGTSCRGGTNNLGTVFKVSPAGVLSVLHSFVFWDGLCPYAGLKLASDGNLYGTTLRGSLFDRGTIFRITPGGAFTTLKWFTGSDGANPAGELAQANDGALYGTTTLGGAQNQGTIFRLTLQGQFTTLRSFPAATPKNWTLAGLVAATDGFLYGTMQGTYTGIPFRISPTGDFTAFGPDLPVPASLLMQASDADFYGTLWSGSGHQSRIFKMTAAGVVTNLYFFSEPESVNPFAPLLEAADGNFYGTTAGTDLFRTTSVDHGSVFMMTPAGALTTLHTFTGADGAIPIGGLTSGPDGTLYGTTYQGGAANKGVVFRITP